MSDQGCIWVIPRDRGTPSDFNSNKTHRLFYFYYLVRVTPKLFLQHDRAEVCSCGLASTAML